MKLLFLIYGKLELVVNRNCTCTYVYGAVLVMAPSPGGSLRNAVREKDRWERLEESRLKFKKQVEDMKRSNGKSYVILREEKPPPSEKDRWERLEESRLKFKKQTEDMKRSNGKSYVILREEKPPPMAPGPGGLSHVWRPGLGEGKRRKKSKIDREGDGRKSKGKGGAAGHQEGVSKKRRQKKKMKDTGVVRREEVSIEEDDGGGLWSFHLETGHIYDRYHT